MSVSIVQLSDIHFKSNGNNFLLDRLDKLVAVVASITKETDLCLLLVTGDIAFSGNKQEYEIAHRFFEELCSKLSSSLKDSDIQIIFIPGNHDCDFSIKNNVRDLLLAQISVNAELPRDILDQMISVQGNYFDFVASWHRDGITQLVNNIHKRIRVQGSDTVIELHLLNSAWMSVIHEQQGKLLFPDSLINIVPEDEYSPSLTITILHHPYQWFEANNARSLRTKLESISDIILTGHEHESTHYAKTFEKSRMEYIEGAVLQGDSPKECGLNVILVDDSKDLYQVNHVAWHETEGFFKVVGCDETPFKRNSFRLRNEYTISSEFNNELTDAGAKYTHPSKDVVSLEDIFVYPHIRQLHLPGDPQWVKTIVQENLVSFIKANKRVLLIGGEKSGKTSLAKILFAEFRKSELVPLIISGDQIKKVEARSLELLLEKTFERTFCSPDYSKYKQLSSVKRVVIIDDFHNCSLNLKGRDQVIKNLQGIADYIVILGNDQLRFADFLHIKPDQDLSYWDFTACEIMEFGKLKRKELIEKWYSLGVAYTIDETTLRQDAIRIEKIISSLIGNNFIPSYPLFILVMLQQLEIRNPVETTAGSYGYLYESLLTMSLSKNPNKDVDVDTQYSYLSELAYILFQKRELSIDSSCLESWHLAYCEKFRLIIDQKRILDYLCNVAILVEDESGISFRYPYIYYYFVARYFRDHITEDGIRHHIKRMSERLHHTESANIIVFLCYLSKDPYILEMLLSASRSLFADYHECNLFEDTNFIANLIPDVPRFVLENKDTDENHRELLAEEDRISNVENDEPRVALDDEKTDKELQELLQVNVAFKNIQILGQLLRNFTGSLTGEQKYALAQECYSLGLRVISFALNNIEVNQREMVETIGEILVSKHPKWQYDRLNEEVKYLVFGILEGLAFVVIRHTSDSVGLERLLLTYDDLLSSNGNISYKFIDLLVRLENFRGFPKNETLDLFKQIRKNRFSSQLLRHMVWYYFYIYPAKHTLRQSICDKLGIQIQPALKFQNDKIQKESFNR